jgi:hypothetical protein
MAKEKMTDAEKKLADAAKSFVKQTGLTTGVWTGEENARFIARRAFENGLPKENLLAFIGELQTLNLGGNARLFGVGAGLIVEKTKIGADDLLAMLGV